MPRTDRLFDLLRILRDGELHTAEDMATALEVSVRTIYRDMDTLRDAGVPVTGARGTGYQATAALSLPPLTLSEAEFEALNLGVAIVLEAADPDLAEAAAGLARKLDAVMPEQALSEADSWKFALSAFSDTARGVRHLSTLRSAIKARQKINLTYRRQGGAQRARIVRPLQVDHWGRVWTLTAWCEARADFRQFRVDLIETATALPELFRDEPGTTLADFHRRRG